MKKPEIEHLESINPFYVRGDYMDALMIEREVELIGQFPNVGLSALEVGCGSGLSTEKLIKLFPTLEVIEPANSNINLLKKRLPNIVCHEALIEDFKPTKKFKNIFFLNVIEHVIDPVASLNALANHLMDEGLIFISAPNCMSLNRRAGYKMGLLESYDKMAPKDIEVGHRRLYTVNMMKEHCEQAGLRLITIKGIYLKPLSEKQMIDLGDAAVRAFYSLGEDVPEYCACLFAVATKKYY